MKTFLLVLFFFSFGYLSAQSILKITYKEKSSDYASIKFISLSDLTKQFHYLQSENVPGDAIRAMLDKQLVHHSLFSDADSIAYWHIVAYPANKEYLIKKDFSSENYNVIFSTKNILSYTCQKTNFLLAILNSKVSEWYFNLIGTTTGMGTNRWKKYKIETLPIKVSTVQQKIFLTAVNETLKLKKLNIENDTIKIENENDILVYQLYNLTVKEIAIIEEITKEKI